MKNTKTIVVQHLKPTAAAAALDKQINELRNECEKAGILMYNQFPPTVLWEDRRECVTVFQQFELEMPDP